MYSMILSSFDFDALPHPFWIKEGSNSLISCRVQFYKLGQRSNRLDKSVASSKSNVTPSKKFPCNKWGTKVGTSRVCLVIGPFSSPPFPSTSNIAKSVVISFPFTICIIRNQASSLMLLLCCDCDECCLIIDRRTIVFLCPENSDHPFLGAGCMSLLSPHPDI